MHRGQRDEGAKNPSRRRPNRGENLYSFDVGALVMNIVTRGVEAFVHQGACPTHAVVIDGHGKPTFLVPQCLPDDNVKSRFAGVIAETANELQAVAVVFLAETWVSGDNWDGVTPVSQCADRREALMATVEIGAEAVVFLWPILRDGTNVHLGECKQLDAEFTTGRFVGLLRQRDPRTN
jgi:hypothetical protein